MGTGRICSANLHPAVAPIDNAVRFDHATKISHTPCIKPRRRRGERKARPAGRAVYMGYFLPTWTYRDRRRIKRLRIRRMRDGLYRTMTCRGRAHPSQRYSPRVTGTSSTVQSTPDRSRQHRKQNSLITRPALSIYYHNSARRSRASTISHDVDALPRLSRRLSHRRQSVAARISACRLHHA